VISLGIVLYLYFSYVDKQYNNITSFDSCVTAGFPLLPTYPETCHLPGKKFLNPRQQKEIASTKPISDTADEFENILSLPYITDGIRATFRKENATTSEKREPTPEKLFLYSGTHHIHDVTHDGKQDILFVAQETASNTINASYLFLAVGLYDGYSGSNGIFIDTDVASTSFIYSTSTITVNYYKKTSPLVALKKVLHIKNDILAE
jgi:hypothetical protein